MESNWEKLEIFQKNLQFIQDVTDELLNHMKGYGISFRSEITDKKGNFSQKKLNDLVEKLLSLWATKLRDGTFTDSATGESLAEPYIQARQELYGSYLYLVMRCTLLQGMYQDLCGGELEERTDFAFLLKQARRLFQNWCVTADPDGNKKNELFWGCGSHFGLHLHRILDPPDLKNFGKCPQNHPEELTDEGYINLLRLKKLYPRDVPELWTDNTKTAAQSDGDSDRGVSSGDEEVVIDLTDSDEDGYDDEVDYDESDIYDYFDYSEDQDLFYDPSADGEYEYAVKRVEKMEHREEYLAAYERFLTLFQQAKPEVLWGFCEDLEEIVEVYLLEQDIPPLSDTEKMLNVYNCIYDGPLRQARRYERGVQWKNL